MTLEELESSWAALLLPGSPDAISGRRAIGLPLDRPVYLAVDNRGRRHLLIQVPENTVPISLRETRSLEVNTMRFQIGFNPESLYVDLVCTDTSQTATFSAIAQDIIRDLRQTSGPLRDSIANALARWRAFWMVKVGEMSREDALGLFGELWFLLRWLRFMSTSAVKQWQATHSARHDFQWPSASVEVKTAITQVTSAPVHHITSLEQLTDPEQGRLYLFSLQVSEDVLSNNTLHSLVTSLTEFFQNDFQALTDFNDKLAARGYSPADHRAPSRPYRILAERLYHVTDGFPRLTRQSFQPNGLPAGIRDIKYEIDLSICDSCLIATQPQDGIQFLS
ncbi:MAG: PD-(D/E)XK motif protein [Desulfobulbaceae bacterium]|nr:PD-(D/E)XK motif protein [Desulfobulbaceae bacterium]